MKDDTVRITLVRHGQSVSNLAQRWQGQGDSPLSELGRQQAQLVGARLAQRTFSRVLSSDLVRAADTARATGIEPEQQAVFREFDVGYWEGLTAQEVEERYPEEMARLKGGEDIPLGGGESYQAFSERIANALAALRAELAPGDHVLLVCHGGVIASLLGGVLGLKRGRGWSISRVANTAITELSFSASSGALLHVFNDTMHLSTLSAWPPHTDVKGSIGLVCEGLPAPLHEGFAAHYDEQARLQAIASAERDKAWAEHLGTRLLDLSAQHPEERVALAAQAGSIRAWAQHALIEGGSTGAGLAEPRAGTLSHVGKLGDRLILLDYGMG